VNGNTYRKCQIPGRPFFQTWINDISYRGTTKKTGHSSRSYLVWGLGGGLFFRHVFHFSGSLALGLQFASGLAIGFSLHVLSHPPLYTFSLTSVPLIFLFLPFPLRLASRRPFLARGPHLAARPAPPLSNRLPSLLDSGACPRPPASSARRRFRPPRWPVPGGSSSPCSLQAPSVDFATFPYPQCFLAPLLPFPRPFAFSCAGSGQALSPQVSTPFSRGVVYLFSPPSALPLPLSMRSWTSSGPLWRPPRRWPAWPSCPSHRGPNTAPLLLPASSLMGAAGLLSPAFPYLSSASCSNLPSRFRGLSFLPRGIIPSAPRPSALGSSAPANACHRACGTAPRGPWPSCPPSLTPSRVSLPFPPSICHWPCSTAFRFCPGSRTLCPPSLLSTPRCFFSAFPFFAFSSLSLAFFGFVAFRLLRSRFPDDVAFLHALSS